MIPSKIDRVAVVKEIKPDEHRVALTPAGARELAALGADVLVERGAGAGSRHADADYVAAGARIVDVDEAWAADLVLKVKEPIAAEHGRLRDDLTLFTYLHLAADAPLTTALADAGTLAIAYETVSPDGRALPLLAPMSEIAGRLAAQTAAFLLQRAQGGAGLLLGGIPGALPGFVAVIGGGMAGYNAAVVALGLGARVRVLDTSVDRLRHLEELFRGRVELVVSNATEVERAALEADIVVGAALIPGARAPKLVTREHIATMREGSVVCDISIDQGGCVETSRPTTHSSPTFVVDGVVHYTVANMPGAVPVTSTTALTNVTLPYARRLVAEGPRAAIDRDPALARGVNVAGGRITNEPVAEAHGLAAVAA